VQWARIEPLLPDRTPKRGGRRRDRRQVIDTIAFTSRTGTQWVHLPEKSGNWRGICHRLRMWAVDGTWERVFTTLMAQADADEDLAWPYRWTPRPCALTSTLPAPGKEGAPADEPADHAIGRYRGGPTTEIPLAADSRCRPLAFVLTAGQVGNAPAFTGVMPACVFPDGVVVRAPGRTWRRRTMPTHLARSVTACASAVSGR
jgi:transposase